MQVKYTDGDEEHLILSNERVKFFVSAEEIQHLKLRLTDGSPETDGIDVNEMVVLAASLDDCEQLEPGDIIWAKLTGIGYRSTHLHDFIFMNGSFKCA